MSKFETAGHKKVAKLLKKKILDFGHELAVFPTEISTRVEAGDVHIHVIGMHYANTVGRYVDNYVALIKMLEAKQTNPWPI